MTYGTNGTQELAVVATVTFGELTTRYREAVEARDNARRARQQADAAVTKATEAFARARSRGANTADKWDMEAQRTQAEAVAAREAEEAAERAANAAEAALNVVRVARNDARLAAMQALLTDADLILVQTRAGMGGEWDTSRYTLMLVDPSENAADVAARPSSRRVRYDVSIEAPMRRYQHFDYGTKEAVYVWRPAELNWATYGPQSVAQARDQIRLHVAAVTIAEYLDAHGGAEWYAEDMAD